MIATGEEELVQSVCFNRKLFVRLWEMGLQTRHEVLSLSLFFLVLLLNSLELG